MGHPFVDAPRASAHGYADRERDPSNRIAAVATELRRLEIEVEEHSDGLTIHPGPIQPATIQTYDDHRMAMSFALIGLRSPGIQIADPGCTTKTYPHYFDDLQKLRGTGQ